MLIVYACLLILPLAFLGLPSIASRFYVRVDISKPTSLTEWLLIVVTLAYAAVSALQWWKMRQALAETRRSNELTLRAWVLIDSVELAELTPDPIAQIGFWLRVRVRNPGKVPAVSVIATLSPETQPLVDPLPIEWPLVPEEALVAAGEDRVFNLGVMNITAERIASLRAGELFLWATIRFTYTDVFGIGRETSQGGYYVRPSSTRGEYFRSYRHGRTMT